MAVRRGRISGVAGPAWRRRHATVAGIQPDDPANIARARAELASQFGAALAADLSSVAASPMASDSGLFSEAMVRV